MLKRFIFVILGVLFFLQTAAFAATVTYYFDSYDVDSAWENNPESMVDGSLSTYAWTSTYLKEEYLDANNCPGMNLGEITKVEIRAYGYYQSGTTGRLVPKFNGTAGNVYGSDSVFTTSIQWSSYYDITNDSQAPDPWGWDDIRNLTCSVITTSGGTGVEIRCYKVEIRVTYVSNETFDSLLLAGD